MMAVLVPDFGRRRCNHEPMPKFSTAIPFQLDIKACGTAEDRTASRSLFFGSRVSRMKTMDTTDMTARYHTTEEVFCPESLKICATIPGVNPAPRSVASW